MSIFDRAKELFVPIEEVAREVPDKLKILAAGRGVQGLFTDQSAPETFSSAFKEGAEKLSFIGDPKKAEEAAINFGPGVLAGVQRKIAPKVFGGFKDITLDTLEKLKGRTKVSKQFISDLTNRPEIRQAERDAIRNALSDEADVVDVPLFANKIKTELLPLKRTVAGTGYGRYENISLPKESRGPVSGYSEHVYKSPIETSAGETHFAGMGADKYFAHSRIEDLPPMTLNASKLGAKTDKIRRVIELQSDLFQKGRLEGEKIPFTSEKYTGQMKTYLQKNVAIREAEISKLEPYRNTWHERIIREEVKQAAKDSKTKLQFPTGETAMKIEGLGQGENNWRLLYEDIETPAGMRPSGSKKLKVEDLEIGQRINQGGNFRDDTDWIITDILGDGKFKAVQKQELDRVGGAKDGITWIQKQIDSGRWTQHDADSIKETFDISGKVDPNNPIYRFYEKEVGRFLTNKFGAKLITDPQGVKWWELNIGKELKDIPVLAHGKATIGSLLGGAAASAGVASLFVPSEKLSYEKQSEEERIPQVVETRKTFGGNIYKLDTGTEVRDVHPDLKNAISLGYQNNSQLPKGLLEALLMKESSMGYNDKNRRKDIGEYAWLGGITKIAKTDLIQNGIVPDLSTREGAIDAMAKFWLLRADPKANIVDNYHRVYSSGLLKDEQLNEFNDMFKYYANSK